MYGEFSFLAPDSLSARPRTPLAAFGALVEVVALLEEGALWVTVTQMSERLSIGNSSSNDEDVLLLLFSESLGVLPFVCREVLARCRSGVCLAELGALEEVLVSDPTLWLRSDRE